MFRDIRHPGHDGDPPSGGQDGNLGHILSPARVAIDFVGNPQAKVRPMPRFLRVVTGDAKARALMNHVVHCLNTGRTC